jgi:hypothetical protein
MYSRISLGNCWWWGWRCCVTPPEKTSLISEVPRPELPLGRLFFSFSSVYRNIKGNMLLVRRKLFFIHWPSLKHTHNGDRDMSSGLTSPCDIKGMDRTSTPPQVKLSLLRSISLKLEHILNFFSVSGLWSVCNDDVASWMFPLFTWRNKIAKVAQWDWYRTNRTLLPFWEHEQW